MTAESLNRENVDQPSQTPITIQVSGILCDMDGTLIDSTEAVVKFWKSVGQSYGLAPEAILATSHGRRSIDVLRTIDPAKATWEYVQEIEGRIPILYRDDGKEIPGARTFLSSLEKHDARWAIVTSATRPVVEGWFHALNLPLPASMITAETVTHGKPHPEPYMQGMEKLNVESEASNCFLVLEDAPAGVKAGKEAGCLVLALTTTHSAEDLRSAGADWIIPDLRSVSLTSTHEANSRISIEISNYIVKG